MEFRKDINGLRAIAVIAVVLFHFAPSSLSGGFAGVDVFFVISGFLMTGIICKGIEQNNFSILSFYVARANRIVPALAVLCFLLLVFGWFCLGPSEYESLGKHVTSSISFLSNITYWQESGYFDADSKNKWLLHSWSLSIEFQFYIIFALLLFLIHQVSTQSTIKIYFLVTAISLFLLSVWMTSRWPEASYYLLPTRAWEFMVGGIAYLYPLNSKQKYKLILEWLGLILIVGSFVFVNQENNWPGYLAFFPVFGAFIILQTNRNNSFLTGNAFCQSIGRWSYSIYLWHWPIVVALTYYSLDGVFVYLGIALSPLLGFLSYELVEKRKLKNQFLTAMEFFNFKPLHMVLIIAVLGGLTYRDDGSAYRYNYIKDIEQLTSNNYSAEIYYKQNLMSAFSNNGDNYENSILCSLDGNKQTLESVLGCLRYHLNGDGFLIFGDSHGRDFLHAVKIAYPDLNFAMLLQSQCVPTTYNLKSLKQKVCFDLLSEIRDELIHGNTSLKGVIFASAYGDDVGLKSLIKDLNNKVYADTPIFVVNSGPLLDSSVVNMAIEESAVKDYYELGGNNRKVLDINESLSDIEGIELLDKYSVFCKKELCKLNNGLEPLIWDTGHLSQQGIKEFSDSIIKSNFLDLQR